MVTNAQSVGYPQGRAGLPESREQPVGRHQSRPPGPGSSQWVQNWATAVKAAGYVPGVYVGVPQILTSADLNSALPQPVGAFWRSASSSAPQTSRGYVMRQPTINVKTCGTTIDVDTSGSGHRAGTQLVGAGFPRAATTPDRARRHRSVDPGPHPGHPDTAAPVPAPTSDQQPSRSPARAASPPPTSPPSSSTSPPSDPTAAGNLVVWPTGKTRPTRLQPQLHHRPNRPQPRRRPRRTRRQNPDLQRAHPAARTSSSTSPATTSAGTPTAARHPRRTDPGPHSGHP